MALEFGRLSLKLPLGFSLVVCRDVRMPDELLPLITPAKAIQFFVKSLGGRNFAVDIFHFPSSARGALPDDRETVSGDIGRTFALARGQRLTLASRDWAHDGSLSGIYVVLEK